MVFERKVLRRIFGPTEERDGTWRIKINDDLDKLIRHKNIINYIKAKRLRWFGHLDQMPEERMVKKSIEVETDVNPLAYTAVSETAGLAVPFAYTASCGTV
jgi:hypothetical protein